MKFLCVPCDSPMKLQTIGPPEGGSLSVVYSCPECGYEMAMLTNAYETQAVQSLGVRIGPESDSKASDRLRAVGASASPAEASAEAGARLSRGTSYLAATTLACTNWSVASEGKVPAAVIAPS